MKVFDLHCDTLSELRYAENDGAPLDFRSNSLHLDLERMKAGDYLLQCMACYTNLGKEKKNLMAACMEMIDIFHRLLEAYPQELMQVKSAQDLRSLSKDGRIGMMLTVEEGGACLDDVRQLRNLYRLGVRMMTLTWNYENGLANPNIGPDEPETQKGLTQKGIEFLEEMERLHMILDVSHLGDAGFWDVVKYAKRPFAASHSNSRALCGHCRNLTDDMIRAMGERGGLIGLNYYGAFLDSAADRNHPVSRIRDMAEHARHIMDVGGDEILALGSDFDGITGELELNGAADMPLLAQGLEDAGFSQDQIERIFYKNAMRFFEENL